MGHRITIAAAAVLYVCLAGWGYVELLGGFPRLFSVVSPDAKSDVFTFSDYLTALALLLLVITTSDFRHRYRLNVSRIDWPRTGFWAAAGIGVGLLLVEVWYGSGLPVPAFARSSVVPKVGLALIFLTVTFLALWVAFVRYPRLSSSNAERFDHYHFHLLHGGDPEQARVVATELQRSMPEIIRFAARPYRDDSPDEVVLSAKRFLSLIADKRFCQVVVAHAPGFALAAFAEAQRFGPKADFPIFQFARNIGQEFIRNTNSAFYQESSGFDSGLQGFQRDTTRIVFGNYPFVEQCATDGESPIDTDDREFDKFGDEQINGYFRAAKAFLKDYMTKTKGVPHSYAFARLMHTFDGIGSRLYRLKGNEALVDAIEFKQLQAAISFLGEAIEIVGKHVAADPTPRVPENLFKYSKQDYIAAAIANLAVSSGSVSAPEWTTWHVQHNEILGVFSYREGQAIKSIAAKFRRLLFQEIKRMDTSPNFQGARALGYCLNVFGLTPSRRGFGSEWYPLQAMALRWAKKNFTMLLVDHPLVAEACLQGQVIQQRHREGTPSRVSRGGRDARSQPAPSSATHQADNVMVPPTQR